MRSNNLHLSLLATFFICQFSHSQITTSSFENSKLYHVNDGVPSTTINFILEDKNAFLWVASNKGVALFDGNYFNNYNYFFENGIYKEIGFVDKLLLDKSGEKLWISGEKGIFYTSLDTISFKTVSAFSSLTKLKINNTIDFIIDDNTILWAANSSKGLLKIDINKKTYDEFYFVYKTKKDNSLLNSILSISVDPNNNTVLWLGTGAGLIRFNCITKKYQVFVYNDNPEMPQNLIRKIEVSKNDVYIGTWSQGLVVFNKATKQFTQPFKKHLSSTNLSIYSFYKDKKNVLWVTTNRGLIKFNTATNTFIKISHNNLKKGILKGISFVDSRGLIWYTHRKGLFKYNPENSKNKFLQLEEKSNLQTPFLVRKIIQLNGFIYVLGHGGSGLYKINPADNSFKNIKISSQETGNFNLRDMVKMDDENLLVLSQKKIYIFNTKTKVSYLSPLQINHPSPSLQSVVKDKNETYWIGGRLSGLTSVNFKTNTTKNYTKEFNIYEEGNHIWINKLYLDSKNKLWIAKGTESVMDLNTMKFSILNPKDSIPFYQDANGFLEDSKGRIWVANYKNGLGILDYKEFNKGVSHLLDGKFTGLYKHNDSIMWTTGDGFLGEFNTNSITHKTIPLNNNNQYIRGPIINYNNDDYIIGCNNGILFYSPEIQDTKLEVSKPYIRKITGNGNIYYESNDLKNKTLRFKSGTTNLVINISGLGFQELNQTTYFYKLQEDWMKIGTSQEINITNLDQGYYTIAIKACNRPENCNTITYNFIILSPWYRSWLAYIIYGLVLFTIGRLMYRFKIDKKLAIAEKQKAIEFDELKSEMYANISHEFRTPLTLINGLSKDLISVNNDPRKVEKLKGIYQNGNHLLKLVNQILGLVSFDAGKVKANYKNGDVITFIKQCVSYYKFYADSKQQQLTISSSIDSLQMDFDDDKLQKIINNLLSNAIKFTPKKGAIMIHIEKINQQLIIQIKDSGKGIEFVHIPHIFDRYYKVFNNDINIGNGIGMAFTKELVTLLNGTISVQSKINQGTTFTLKLPITNKIEPSKKLVHQIPFVDNVASQITSPKKTKAVQKTHSILVVEDNKELREYLQSILEFKYTIFTAKNGIKGLKIAQEKNINFIISDVMMPEMDGFEFCQQIKSNLKTSHIPFIIISAKTEIKDKIKGYKLGIDTYLFKPFNKEELLLIIKNLLTKKQEQITFFSKLLHLKEGSKSQNINQLDIDLIGNLQEQVLEKNKNIAIDELAKTLGTSRTQLHRKLKALTNMSVTRYINHIRIEKAKNLLVTTKLNSNEIAYEIGFESATYFSRIFKKEEGITPVSYRKNNS